MVVITVVFYVNQGDWSTVIEEKMGRVADKVNSMGIVKYMSWQFSGVVDSAVVDERIRELTAMLRAHVGIIHVHIGKEALTP